MRIAICSSMAFAKKMVEVKSGLEALCHQVIIQDDVMDYVEGRRTDEDKWRKLEIDPLKSYFEEIKKADAIIVVNEPKRGVENYIGGNTLIEMAFAYVLDKRIYILNQIPDMPYTDEICAMKPIVLSGDLSKVID